MPRRKSAYTLIEILVVLFIIAILIGITIPAVLAVREAGRSLACVANLKQIGIALHGYNATHMMFPPNWLKTGLNHSNNRMSGLAYVLPWMESETDYNSINVIYVRGDCRNEINGANQTIRATIISTFLCPSDLNMNYKNSYRFNHGVFDGQNKVFNGPFSFGVLPSDATVTDGLSNTIFLSERVSGSFIKTSKNFSRDVNSLVWPGAYYPGDEVFINYCQETDALQWNVSSGNYWLFNGMLDTEYNHNGLPNDPRPSCGGTDYGLFPPRSYHYHRVNVLFGDGHVTKVSNSINKNLWITLGTHQSSD